jgi:hypothetical protein
LRVSGGAQEVTAETMAGSICRLSLAIMYTRMETEGAWNSHYSALMYRELSRRRR